MRILTLFAAATTGALLLAGCQTSNGSPTTDVTRFHMNQPIARGQIAVEPADRSQLGSLQFAQVAAPVERELRRLGWSVSAGDGRSEQVALVTFRQGSRAASANRPAVSVGVGGGTGGWRSGVGVGVGANIPVGAGGSSEVVMSELAVRVQRRSDATVMWEGRAQTEARFGTPLADPRAAADRLAAALFQGFPGESGRTIRVR